MPDEPSGIAAAVIGIGLAIAVVTASAWGLYEFVSWILP